MEFMKIRLILQISLLALCTACGGAHQVKGESPFVRISSMSVRENSLTAEFDIHNVNDVKMDIDAIDIRIMGKNTELGHYTGNLSLSVDPNTTEEVSLTELDGEEAKQILNSLESGQIASLPFSLEGRVHTADDGYLSFKNEGHLYPVPGRPGQFRSASSRAREER